MRHPAIIDLYKYWNRLRGTRAAPDRLEVDPAAIRHILNHTFILEAGGEITFNIRLAGGRFNALWMREMKGRPLLPLFGDDAPRLSAALWTVMDSASPIVADMTAGPAGYDGEEFEMIFLPLSHQGALHSRVLGACASFKNPSWLGLVPVARLKLKALALMLGENLERTLPLPPTDASQLPSIAPISRRYGRFQVFYGGAYRPSDASRL